MTMTVAGRFAGMQAGVESMRMPWGAVATSRLSLGEVPFEIELEMPRLGRIRLPSARLEGYRTGIVVRVGVEGGIDVSQYLVRPGIAGDPLLRLQLGQQLYKSGELLEAPVAASLLPATAAGEGDPLLACMALHLAADAEGALDPAVRSALAEVAESLVTVTALPDAPIAVAGFGRWERADLLEPLLEAEVEPLLDRSAAALAAYALETGRSDHPLVRRRAWVPPRQAWNLSWRRPGGAQMAAPTGTKALQ
jgi:hypothetical protein